jgi:DNA modification methylase
VTEVIQGDCLDVLPTLDAESVQTVVTSPPYWGLRDYGTAEWEGGVEGCDHAQDKPKFNGPKQTRAQVSGHASKAESNNRTHCKCGARRIDAQFGLEPTPEAYVANMVRVFREVWRVLKNDGCIWINLGDSYASGGCGEGSGKQITNVGSNLPRKTAPPGLKPKDLCMMPARVAMALQADGWTLRSEIVWAKPNPMPESVTDRPTKSHEMIYLLSKRASYFYNADAIREENSETSQTGGTYLNAGKYSHRDSIGRTIERNGRNKRSVWTVATSPFSEAHFATFPPDLIKPCILAGSRLGDTVLDPFAGSGTVGLVATEYGRKSVLIELNPAYVAMIHDRTNVTVGML